MKLILALLTGVIFSIGVYMIMRRSIVRLIIGFILLSHSVNLAVFLSGKLVIGGAPLIPEDAEELTEPVSDPLPQALILTAIVIGFGLLAFSIILINRIYKSLKTEDLNDMKSIEKF